MLQLDRIDRRILEILQSEGRLPMDRIGSEDWSFKLSLCRAREAVGTRRRDP
jgi:hypothetical protein